LLAKQDATTTCLKLFARLLINWINNHGHK